MPITQERLLALLQEAEAHRNAFADLRSEMLNFIDQSVKRPENQSEACVGLIAAIRAIIRGWPIPPAERITVERYHHEHFSRRNERAREKMASLRSKRQRRVYHHAPISAAATMQPLSDPVKDSADLPYPEPMPEEDADFLAEFNKKHPPKPYRG